MPALPIPLCRATRRARAAIAATALVCALAVADGAAAQQKVTINHAGAILGRAPFYLAIQSGFFKAEGLDVELVRTSSGSDGLKMLAGGAVNFHVSQLIDGVLANKQGLDVKGVAMVASRMDNMLMIRKDLAGKVKSVRDLKDRLVGVTGIGSGTWQFVNYLGRLEGMTPEDFKFVSLGSGAPIVAAFKAGRVEALSYSAPETYKLAGDGDAVFLVDMTEDAAHRKYIGDVYLANQIMVTGAYARQNPKIVQGVVNAMQRSLNWMHAQPIEAVVTALVAFPDFRTADPAHVTAFMRNILPTLHKTAIISVDAYNNAIKLPKTIGAIDAAPPIQAVVDNSFAQEAARILPPAR